MTKVLDDGLTSFAGTLAFRNALTAAVLMLQCRRWKNVVSSKVVGKSFGIRMTAEMIVVTGTLMSFHG